VSRRGHLRRERASYLGSRSSVIPRDGPSPPLISRKLVRFHPCMASWRRRLRPGLGSGNNQRCFDLRLQPFSNLDWQFDVCPPAVAICDGQHNRAMVCCSGANVAHSPLSGCCVRGHGAIVSARLQRVAASLIMPIASWLRIDFIRFPALYLPRYSDSPAVDLQQGLVLRGRRELPPVRRSAFRDPEVVETHPPRPGKKLALVKTKTGEAFNVWPDKLAALMVGGAYQIEFEENEFNGRIYRKITRFSKVAANNNAQTAQPGNHPTDDGERQFVREMLAAGVKSGAVIFGPAELHQAIVMLRAEDKNGTAFEYDKPSTFFAQFHDPKIDEVSHNLDDRLAALLAAVAR
jgi:hypothetical protein